MKENCWKVYVKTLLISVQQREYIVYILFINIHICGKCLKIRNGKHKHQIQNSNYFWGGREEF